MNTLSARHVTPCTDIFSGKTNLVMKKKKRGLAAQAVAPPATVSPSTETSPAEIQNQSKAPYVPPVYPYTPSRQEKREYAHAKLKGEPVWVNEPEWVKSRKSKHGHSISQSRPTIFSISPPGLKLPCPGRPLSPTVPPFTPLLQMPPQPKLQPLIFTRSPSGAPLGSSSDKPAAHAAWWARISNALAAYSTRSYHLFVASSFLSCATEELLLLYEVRRLNADGKRLFEEVLRGLRTRNANWEGSMDELRISWDMEAKREMLVGYDAFVAEQVCRLERDLSGEAGECNDGGDDDGSDTVVNSRPSQDGCAVDGPSCEDSPTETLRTNKCDTSWEDSAKTGSIESCGSKEVALADRSLANRLSFDWADDAIEASQDELKSAVKGRKQQGVPAFLRYDLASSPSDAAIPSPISSSGPTWAAVLASPIKIEACGSDLVSGLDASSSKDWGDISGGAWAWERNWK